MEFYLGDIRLPVPISEVNVKSGSEINIVSLAKGGEIAFFKGRKLENISFSGFYPSECVSYCQYPDFPSPESFCNQMKSIMEQGDPIRFIITDTDINNQFLIESFEKVYKVNGRGDIDFSISLIEYKELVIPQIAPPKKDSSKVTEKTPQKRPNDKKNNNNKNRTHTVVRGDTLWGLAKRYYGDGSQYMKIFNANKGKIKNPNLIIDGWKLVIP